MKTQKLKVITYNIDGLPEQLDLNDLPAILKPITWIYKLIKKTTIVKINDNSNTAEKIKHISKYLALSKPDIIGVQEDFNYHNELMSQLANKYNCCKNTGGFDISKIFSSIECISYFPLPRFKADGMNLIFNPDKVKILTEDIVTWNDSYGYTGHANDLLTHKGFRFYNVLFDNIDIDIYIVHMDADFYHPINCPDVSKDIAARKSQIYQLLTYIFNRYDASISHPIIVMGDTNSYDKYAWDKENIEYFINNINHIDSLHCEEVKPNNYNDCDRIFIINNDNSKYKLIVDGCSFDMSFNEEIGAVSDHKPLVATFNLIENNNKN